MGIETESPTTAPAHAVPTPRRKPLSRHVLHHMRRLHLFLGLLLLPWAVLYGASAFTLITRAGGEVVSGDN
jgi:hypothetical protein